MTPVRAATRSRLLGLLGAVVMVLAACGDGETGSSTTSSAGGSTLAFTAPAVGGGTVDVDVAATGPTVFWFWAPG